MPKQIQFVVGVLAGAFVAWGAFFLSLRTVLPPAYPGLPAMSKYYMSDYKGNALDYYILVHDLFGVGKHVRKAQVLLASSSKGLYGFRTEVFDKTLASRGFQIKSYNLSFGYGEGLALTSRLLEKLDIHDATLIIDLNENTARYQYSPNARKSLETDWLSAYRIVLSMWAEASVDWAITPWLPRWRWRNGVGAFSPPFQGASATFRAWSDNNLLVLNLQPGRYLCETGIPTPYAFDRDKKIADSLFEAARERNIRIIGTAIPYRGDPKSQPIFDPVWAARSAREAGIPFVPIPWEGLLTMDGGHLDGTSAEIFTSRLAEGFVKLGTTGAK